MAPHSETLSLDTLPRPVAGPAMLRPPAPEPVAADLPWYRLIASFRTNALPAWTQRAYEEPVVPRRVFGRTSLLVNAPEAIRYVLIDGHEKFGRTPAGIRILRPVIGEGLFLSEGEAWRHQRRTLAPAFTPRAVDLLVPHILKSVRQTIADLESRNGEPVDLLAAMQFLALDIAGRTMFSLEMDRHGPALRAMFQQYNRNLGRPRLLDFLMPLHIPNPYDVARRRFQAKWMGLVERIMSERRSAGTAVSSGMRDLYDLMLAARDPETGAAFSPVQLRDQVATMILAGHETTAVALFWSLYLVALAPEWQERIAQEAGDAEGDAHAAAARLVQTRAVIDEAMRLYPPAFAIVRSAREDDVVCGRAVQRGDTIVIAPWVLHRHRTLWQDPAAFDPARFLPGAPPIDRFAYLPFGVGPRVCIGTHFALTEATLALAALVQAFRIELADPARPVLPTAVITTQPDHAPPFRLHRR